MTLIRKIAKHIGGTFPCLDVHVAQQFGGDAIVINDIFEIAHHSSRDDWTVLYAPTRHYYRVIIGNQRDIDISYDTVHAAWQHRESSMTYKDGLLMGVIDCMILTMISTEFAKCNDC
jgi:hypothetical protein